MRAPRSWRVALAALAGGLAALAAACAGIAGLSDLEVAQCKGGLCTDATVAEAGGGDSGTDAPPNDCPGTKGPPGVRVTAGANSFCIDSTEVTFGQYREFVEAKLGDTSGQPAECAFNTSYAVPAIGGDDEPVTNISWCDAVAYCKWAGKKLCGRIGSGVLSEREVSVPAVSQWLYACSGGGKQNFPYGADFDATKCNVLTDAGTKPVKSNAGCQGSVPGIYDLVGNVWEWIDSECVPNDGGIDASKDATPGQYDLCNARGASYANPGTGTADKLNCNSNARAPRSAKFNDVGFRCCSP